MKKTLLLGFLGVGLLASLLGNGFLFQQAVSRMRLEASVRLAPTYLVYREANRRQAPPREGVQRVVLFGDSRIREWTGLPGDGRFEFINRGIGGETTAQMLGRLEADVIALRPAFVVLQLGVNDLKQFGVLKSPGKLGEQTRDRIEEIAGSLHAAGIPTIVMTIFPVSEIPLKRRLLWSSQTGQWITRINSWLREGGLGEDIHVWDCDTFLDRDGKMDPAFARDALHLNQAGYRELSRRIVPVLESVGRELAPQSRP